MANTHTHTHTHSSSTHHKAMDVFYSYSTYIDSFDVLSFAVKHRGEEAAFKSDAGKRSIPIAIHINKYTTFEST